jgi:hypothetical protein
LHRSPRPDKTPKIETDWNVKFDGFLTEAICKGERSARVKEVGSRLWFEKETRRCLKGAPRDFPHLAFA